MPFNKPLPEWMNPGVKPNQGLIDAGWKPDDKPPADVHNWWMNTSYEAIKQLQEEAINKDQIGVANGVAPLGDDGKVPASMVSGNTAEIETQLENHIQKDLGHVRFFESSGIDTISIKTTAIPMVDPTAANPVPVTGVALRFKKLGNNTSNVKFYIIKPDMTKPTLEYPLLDGQGKQLNAGALVNGGIYTIAFSGTAFFLQGSGSGVTAGTQNYQAYYNPGSYNFVVPDGVTRIIASMWGAGGGGGGVSSNNTYGGGGGGSGFFKEVLLQVLPGQNLSIYVGNGGTGGGIGANGAPGQTTTITGAINGFFEAPGGGGGACGQSAGAGYGGSGATAISTGFSYNISTGSMLKDGTVTVIPTNEQMKHRKFISGGTGCYGATGVGGGGGGSASDMHFGQSGGIGNVSNPGANGGSGFGFYSTWPGGRGGSGQSTSQANGLTGGGGGGGSVSYNGSQIGGNGGNGQVVLAW